VSHTQNAVMGLDETGGFLTSSSPPPLMCKRQKHVAHPVELGNADKSHFLPLLEA